MHASAMIMRQDFESAVGAARSLGPERELPGLSAPLDIDLAGRVSAAWNRIEAALRMAFEHGRDKAKELAESAVDAAEQLIAQAGHRAYDVHQALLAKLQAYVNRLVDTALAHVRTHLVLGGVGYALSDVELSQRISVTGSLSTNITDLVALTSAGEISVTARYAAPGGGVLTAD